MTKDSTPNPPYHLALADRAYSSWSLRGSLLFEKFDLPRVEHFARLYSDDFRDLLAHFAPARTVPALRLPGGLVVPDSIAIAEELASRHPANGLWPQDPQARAVARALVAEMHAGFTALRDACPMNLRVAYCGYRPDDAVERDLRRLEHLWQWARESTGAQGPWLCGAYCAADAFFAPVAARIAGYGLSVAPEAGAYVAAHLADPAFRRWRAMALVDGADQPVYARPYAQTDWPGPAAQIAIRADDGPSENALCPYSASPVTHFLSLDGRVFGFCNPFCRDKTLADPQAWPAFMEIYHS